MPSFGFFNIPTEIEGKRVRKVQPYLFHGQVNLPISAASLDISSDAFNNVLGEHIFIGRFGFAAVALDTNLVELASPTQDEMLRFLSIEFKLGQTDEGLQKTRVRLSTIINDDEPHWDIRETPLHLPPRSTFNIRATNNAVATITNFGAPYVSTRFFVTLHGARVYLAE
jgi:hypothetical protein